MTVLFPRSGFSSPPKQWVGLLNISLLLFVTFMFGLVVFNMHDTDQQLISVLDSSVDRLATDLLHSHTNPYWRTVGRLSVYSSFYSGDVGEVLIVGSSGSIAKDDLRCLLEYEGEDDVSFAVAEIRKISNCSQAAVLSCHSERVPKKVALVSHARNVPRQWMDVEIARTDSNRTSGFPKIAACVRPLEGEESVKDVAQFVAFYETVGVDHIYFYDHKATQEVVNFIMELKGTGYSVNHLPWNKNLSSKDCPVLWSEHVLDCVHRGLGKYSDAVTVGLSDFVVPTEYFKLPLLLEQIRESGHKFSQLKSANFCEDSPVSDIKPTDFGKMKVRGELKPSNSNYIIHLDPEFVFGFGDHISDVTLPESDVSVHRHSNHCDPLGVYDFSGFKYSHIMEQSSVLKLYKRTKRVDDSVTSASV